MSKTNPLVRIVTSAKVQIAVVALVGIVLTLLNIPEEKKEQWLTLVGAIFGLAIAVIAGWAYEDGKLKESQTPALELRAGKIEEANIAAVADQLKPPLRIMTLLAIGLVGSIGCAPIQPGHDPIVVNAERTLAASFDVIDTFLSVEHERRETVRAELPDVHAFAEQLRREAPAALTAAKSAIDAYKASRDRANADAMNNTLAAVETLARQSRLHLSRIYIRRST